MYIYIYVYICTYIYIYIYMYMWARRRRYAGDELRQAGIQAHVAVLRARVSEVRK